MKQLTRLSPLLPLAMTLIWLQFLPERIPAHYNFAGEIDRWGSKWECLLLPGVVLVMGLIFLLVDAGLARRGADEKSEAYNAANRRVLQTILLLSVLFFTALQAYILYKSGKNAVSGGTAEGISRVTALGMAFLFIALGNLMPKSRRNSAMGFRCGWSMYNDVTWRKCNRFAGILMMAAGVLLIPLALLLPEGWAVPVLLAVLTCAVVVSLVYAHRVYRAEKG